MSPALPIGVLALIAFLLMRDKKGSAEPKRLPPASEAANRPQPTQPPAYVPKESAGVQYLPSPLAGVSDYNWTRFVGAMMDSDNKADIDSYNRYGKWRFHANRLAELGYMTNPYQTNKNGKTIWVGTWVPPWTTPKFLDPAAQYAAFVESIKRYDKAVNIDPSQSLPTIEGLPLTRSGMLALLHRAGPKQAQSWISNAADRRRFSFTTKFYKKATDLF